jgi:hypothetical protein
MMMMMMMMRGVRYLTPEKRPSVEDKKCKALRASGEKSKSGCSRGEFFGDCCRGRNRERV